MGFLSWVRRVRQAPDAPAGAGAAGRGAGAGRPLSGMIGGPNRIPPTQIVGHPEGVPTPVTHDRIRAWLEQNGYAYFVDSDGDIGGLWRRRLFYLFLFGSHEEILQIRGQWNRELAIERLPEVLEICNRWNADYLWPKAYARVRDDGAVHVTCEVATDLEHGVNDAQLGDLVHCGLQASSTFFDALDVHYPDPAAMAP